MDNSQLIKQAQIVAKEFLEFVNKAVSPYHVTGIYKKLYIKIIRLVFE